jgi:hypothetical protein
MMMRCLELGGLICDKNEKDPLVLEMFRNPQGLYEPPNDEMIISGQINTVKIIGRSLVSKLPADMRLISIDRPLSAILKSWRGVADRGAAQGRLGMDAWYTEMVNRATVRNGKWLQFIPTLPDLLRLDYDVVVADPVGAMAQIAAHIDTTAFTFDQAAAASGVDASMYINRSTP